MDSVVVLRYWKDVKFVKVFKYFLLMFVMFFLVNVHAQANSVPASKYGQIVLCEYDGRVIPGAITADKDFKIYYGYINLDSMSKNQSQINKYGEGFFEYDQGARLKPLELSESDLSGHLLTYFYSPATNSGKGYFDGKFVDASGNPYRLTASTKIMLEDFAICPTYVYHSDSDSFMNNECFQSENETYCEKNYVTNKKNGYIVKQKLTSSLLGDLSNRLKKDIDAVSTMNADEIEQLLIQLDSATTVAAKYKEKVETGVLTVANLEFLGDPSVMYILQKIYGIEAQKEWEYFPAGILRGMHYFNKDYVKKINKAISSRVEILEAEIINKAQVDLDNGVITEEEYNEMVAEARELFNLIVIKVESLEISFSNAGVMPEMLNPGCDDIIRPKTREFLSKILKVIRFVVPIIVILMSGIDYLKAIASHDGAEVKKATATLAKRLIVVALIFVVPVILDVLLELFDYVYCSIK